MFSSYSPRRNFDLFLIHSHLFDRSCEIHKALATSGSAHVTGCIRPLVQSAQELDRLLSDARKNLGLESEEDAVGRQSVSALVIALDVLSWVQLA